jgi:SAM-dependent methyltransferase
MGISYDRRAALYDAIVGRRLYHRLVWGMSAARYAEFGRQARMAAGDAPFAEVGCGSLLFTAGLHREPRAGPVVLVDRSGGMLKRAVRRLASNRGANAVVLQADATALPLTSGVFSSVLLLNLLHVPCDRAAIVSECGRLLTPGRGRLFVTCLVRSGRWGDVAMDWFHHAGQLHVPLTADQAAAMVAGTWGAIESLGVEGNMAFLVARHAG